MCNILNLSLSVKNKNGHGGNTCVYVCVYVSVYVYHMIQFIRYF